MYAQSWQAMLRYLTLPFSGNRVTGLQAPVPASNRQDGTKGKKLIENKTKKKRLMIPFPDTKTVPYKSPPFPNC